MSHFSDVVGLLTIPVSAQNSNVMEANITYGDSTAIMVAAAAANPLLTYTWQVSFNFYRGFNHFDEEVTSAATWTDLEDDSAAAVLLPAAGRSRAYADVVLAPALRVRASATVTGTPAIFSISKQPFASA